MLIKSIFISTKSECELFGLTKFSRSKYTFFLVYKNDTQRASAKSYILPNVEINIYNVTINGENLFDQPVKNNKVT